MLRGAATGDAPKCPLSHLGGVFRFRKQSHRAMRPRRAARLTQRSLGGLEPPRSYEEGTSLAAMQRPVVEAAEPCKVFSPLFAEPDVSLVMQMKAIRFLAPSAEPVGLTLLERGPVLGTQVIGVGGKAEFSEAASEDRNLGISAAHYAILNLSIIARRQVRESPGRLRGFLVLGA